MASTIVIQFGLPYMPVKRYRIRDELKTLFPPGLLRQYQFLPIDKIGTVMSVVAGGLLTPHILSELEQMAGARILVYVGKQSEIKEVIESEFAASVAQAEKEESGAESLSSLGNMLLGE